MKNKFVTLLTRLVSLSPWMISFLIIFLYVSFINIWVIKGTPEVILIQFAVLILIFFRFRFLDFVKIWVPFISFFVLYEYLRSVSDNLSPFYPVTLYWLYDAEIFVFGKLPSLNYQQFLSSRPVLVNLLLFFYSLFFYYSFLIAFLIWFFRRELFKKYAIVFVLFTYLNLFFFFLIPTAPPWMVSLERGFDLGRYLYGETILKDFSNVTIYRYFINNNLVAAFPSLHVGWPAFSTFFVIKNFKKKAYWALLVIPLLIGASVVVSGEHYVLDVVAGLVLAWLFVFKFWK